MKKILILLFLHITLFSFSQSKMEAFCLENGLEIISTYEDRVVAKFSTNELASTLGLTYDYEFEAIFNFSDSGAVIRSIRNIKASNNAVTLSMTEYRGGLKENIMKGTWKKVITNVNEKCHEIVVKYESYNK